LKKYTFSGRDVHGANFIHKCEIATVISKVKENYMDLRAYIIGTIGLPKRSGKASRRKLHLD
jgi:hypothetical protein